MAAEEIENVTEKKKIHRERKAGKKILKLIYYMWT